MPRKTDLPTDLIHASKAARIAQICTSGMIRWILKKKLPGWKRGGRWFVSRADVEALFREYQAVPRYPPLPREQEDTEYLQPSPSLEGAQ